MGQASSCLSLIQVVVSKWGWSWIYIAYLKLLIIYEKFLLEDFGEYLKNFARFLLRYWNTNWRYLAVEEGLSSCFGKLTEYLFLVPKFWWHLLAPIIKNEGDDVFCMIPSLLFRDGVFCFDRQPLELIKKKKWR